MTASEKSLLALPQVVPLCYSDPLFAEICKIRLDDKTAGFRISDKREREVLELIENVCPEIDLRGIQFCMRRYHGDLVPPRSREDVLQVVAKSYLHRYRSGT
jgi:hypothetical protein